MHATVDAYERTHGIVVQRPRAHVVDRARADFGADGLSFFRRGGWAASVLGFALFGCVTASAGGRERRAELNGRSRVSRGRAGAPCANVRTPRRRRERRRILREESCVCADCQQLLSPSGVLLHHWRALGQEPRGRGACGGGQQLGDGGEGWRPLIRRRPAPCPAASAGGPASPSPPRSLGSGPG